MTENNTEDISRWLTEISEKFNRLSDEQRNEVLDRLIEESSSTQLHHLAEKLPLLVKRDFVRLLPFELVENLLQFLDGKTLLRCCCVSQTWNKVIGQSYRAWRKSCIIAGANPDYVDSSCDTGDCGCPDTPVAKAMCYKNCYLQTLNKLQEFKSDQTFGRVILKGHTSRIMAVYYNNGKIATGSDDHTVRLWDVLTEKCVLKVVTNSVSDIKFDEQFILIACFDNTAACLDVTSGEMIQTYVGHIAAVFSIDFNVERNLVVTGAADRVIILWQLSTGDLLQSIAGYHTGWVMKVRLLPLTLDLTIPPLPPEEQTTPLLTSSSHSIRIISACSHTAFTWTVIRDNGGYRVAQVRNVHSPPENFSLHQSFQVGSDMSSFYLSEKRGHEGYLYCSPVKADITPSDTCKLVHLNETHDVLLGVGKRYAAFVDFRDTDTLKIVDLVRKETVARHYLPPCRPSKNGSTFSLGPCDWLDGIGPKTEGLFVAVCLKSNDVLLLKWKGKCFAVS